MTYLIRHDRRNSFKEKFYKMGAVLLIALILIFTLNHFNFTRSFLADALFPFVKIGDLLYGSAGAIPTFFSDKNKLIEENKKIQEELDNARLQMFDYQSISEENQKLREELRAKPEGNYVASSVVGKPPQTPIGSFHLDKGTEDGIQKGDLVLVSGRTLIGKVAEVMNDKSIVALNSSAGMISCGFIERTNEQIELNGTGGSSLQAKVPIDFDIVSGDKVMQNGSVMYLVAIVGATETDQAAGIKNVYLALPLSISKINSVFVKSSAPAVEN